MSVSPNVVIMTFEELRQKEDAAFHRGVERGKFEAASAATENKRPIARNCANWSGGECSSCGVPWQGMQVDEGHACTNFRRRTPS